MHHSLAKGRHGWCRTFSATAPHPSGVPLGFWELERPSSARSRTITLEAKGMPRLLQEMCLEHTDHAMIHHLQQGRGVRLQKYNLDVGVEVLQHLGVGGGIVQDHQDLEGEALRRAIIILHLVKELCLAVGLEYTARHPTTGVVVPVDGQAFLFIAFKDMRGLCMVDQDGLYLTVSRQVSPEQEGETVLISLKSGGTLLLPRDVCAFSHLFPQ